MAACWQIYLVMLTVEGSEGLNKVGLFILFETLLQE